MNEEESQIILALNDLQSKNKTDIDSGVDEKEKEHCLKEMIRCLHNSESLTPESFVNSIHTMVL